MGEVGLGRRAAGLTAIFAASVPLAFVLGLFAGFNRTAALVGLGVSSGVFLALCLSGRNLRLNIISALCSIYFGLIIAEAALHLYIRWMPFSVREGTFQVPSDFSPYAFQNLPSVNAKVLRRAGDIVYISGREPKERELRTIEFITDRFGYRNTGIKAHRFVLVGDSFVMGNGLSQEETLSEVLRRDYGIESYNLGHPSSPIGYFANIEHYKDLFSDWGNKKFIVFFFEGNDFGPISVDSLKEYLVNLKYKNIMIQKVLSKILLRKYIIVATNKVKHLIQRNNYNGNNILNFEISGNNMIMLKVYVDNSTYFPDNYDSSSLNLLIKTMKEAVDGNILFVYVPTKYTVYYDLISSPQHPPPHGKYSLISREACGRAKVEFLDLTPVLTREAEARLGRGQFVYWPDDTHWTPLGVRVVADALAKRLKGEAG